jgi:hypothetical protein
MPLQSGTDMTGTKMAGDDKPSEAPSEADVKATYERFMGITKWVVIGVSLVLILMALFLV